MQDDNVHGEGRGGEPPKVNPGFDAIVRKLQKYIDTYPGYRPVVYVDVDGTLLLEGGLINQTIVNSVRLIKGSFEDEVKIVLWSAGGEQHALDACKAAQLENVVDYCIAKPIVAIDDMGFNGPMILADVLDEELVHQATPLMLPAEPESKLKEEGE